MFQFEWKERSFNLDGSLIELTSNNSLKVPEKPVIPYIAGDGVGTDIWRASRLVFDAAVNAAYDGSRRVIWLEATAGEKAHCERGLWLPDETLEILRRHRVAIKGPLATPVGGGIRSLNVMIRHKLDLYACIRPVRYISGVPSPVMRPDDVDMVIFRENTEDVYAGLEWASGSPEAAGLISYIREKLGADVRADAAVGLKPMSPFGSKRLVRRAVKWALENGRSSVTLVHKGNIMKFTEGAFRDWGYDVAREEFPDLTVSEEEVNKGISAEGKVIIKDRIADAMFQQVLLRPREYDVLAMPNLNGDYLSDALAAQVGGLGMAPGANVGDEAAVFEATHGTAPKYAGKDVVNPGSMILSGALMFDYIGWKDAAEKIRKAVERTVSEGVVTYDLARQLEHATKVKCSEFGRAVAQRM
jgi:isocitrate dehydrogenase